MKTKQTLSIWQFIVLSAATFLFTLPIIAQELDPNPDSPTPIIITENGMADADGSTNKRAQYIISHLQMALKAYRDGADIRGYYLWTLTDNFEWREGMRNEAHFGLYHVNTNGKDVSDTSDSLARSPTAAVAAFRAIVTNNGISQSHINTYGSFPQLPKP